MLAMPQSEIGSGHFTNLAKLMASMTSNVKSIDQLVTNSIYLNSSFSYAQAQRLTVFL
jgi:hypothetical protein